MHCEQFQKVHLFMCQIEALKMIKFCNVWYFLRVKICHGEFSFGADEESWFYDVVSDSRATYHENCFELCWTGWDLMVF